MPIIDIYSKRQNRLKDGDQKDVYQYDTLPDTFRNQVIHIWQTSIGVGSDSRPTESNIIWDYIHDGLAREKGVLQLNNINSNEKACQSFKRCKYYCQRSETDEVLDIVELSFQCIDRMVRKFATTETQRCSITQEADDALSELNFRFKEHAIGYEFTNGELIRIDSQLLHVEVIKPALSLLNSHGISGPEQEFLRAHEHYRKGNFKEAITEAQKAFESTMKAICDIRQWTYNPNANANQLILLIMTNGLIPSYLQTQFISLSALLESGSGTIRNKTSAHGQGSNPIHLPDYLVAYALHLAASNIVFLIEAHENS